MGQHNISGGGAPTLSGMRLRSALGNVLLTLSRRPVGPADAKPSATTSAATGQHVALQQSCLWCFASNARLQTRIVSSLWAWASICLRLRDLCLLSVSTLYADCALFYTCIAQHLVHACGQLSVSPVNPAVIQHFVRNTRAIPVHHRLH